MYEADKKRIYNSKADKKRRYKSKADKKRRYKSKADIVRILLEHGADVNSKSVNGKLILCHNIYL